MTPDSRRNAQHSLLARPALLGPRLTVPIGKVPKAEEENIGGKRHESRRREKFEGAAGVLVELQLCPIEINAAQLIEDEVRGKSEHGPDRQVAAQEQIGAVIDEEDHQP